MRTVRATTPLTSSGARCGSLRRREREQVLHHLARAGRLGANDLDGFPLRGRERRFAEEQLRERADAAERVVDLVRHAGDELAHGGEPIGLHQAHAQLALLRHVAADEQHARRIGLGQAARGERDDARGTSRKSDLHFDAGGTSLEGSGEGGDHRAAVDRKNQLDERATNDLVRLQSEDFAHRVVRLANASRRMQDGEHGIGRGAKQRAKAPLRLLHRLEELGVRECDGQQVGHRFHALELERRKRVDLRRDDGHGADALAAPLHWNDGHAADRVIDFRVPVVVHLIAVLVHIGDAPAPAGANDAAYRRAGNLQLVAGEWRERAARRGELDHAIVGEETERGAIRLRDVGGRLEEAVEHAARIELQRDLLAEPPHAVQHALRVIELERALDDALLERGLQLLFRRDAEPKLLGGEPLCAERVVAIEREQTVERRDGDSELEGAGVLHAERRRGERRNEQPQFPDAERERQQGERTEDHTDEPLRAHGDGDRGNRERSTRENERRAERRRRRLPGTQQQHAEQHHTGELRARDQSRRERGGSERRQLHP